MRYRGIRGVLAATAPLAVVFAVACDDSDGPAEPSGVTSYTETFDWECAAGTNCQDVFDFEFQAGSTISITVNQVSSGSVAQLALYGPGVALGGVNLLTGTQNELRCNETADCNAHTDGQSVASVAIAQAGRHRVAVTRHWGNSCGGSGTYALSVTSATPFVVTGQTAEDQTSQAPGFECGG